MGNSTSQRSSYSCNDERVVKSLRSKIDGIPIWPPVKKLSPLDIVVVHKNGSVETLGLGLKAKQLEDVKNDLDEVLQEVAETRNAYTIYNSEDTSGEVRASLLQSFANASGHAFMKHHKDLAVSIDKMKVTKIATKNNDSEDALIVLTNAMEGAKIDDLYKRNKKRIYIVTEVTDTAGFTVSSLKDNQAGTGVKIAADSDLGFKVLSKADTSFEASDVTIAIKALRFNVTDDGVLEQAMHVCFDKYRTDNGEEDHELQELDDIPQNIEEVSATARNKFALLIGNNNYENTNSLSGCIKDVHNFKTYLNDHGGFKTENIDTQQNLTYKKILEKMDLFASGGKNHDVGEGDLVVFYYAGHGSRRRTDDGSSPIPFAEDTICPIDTYHAGDGSNRDISRNMIQAWVSKMKSKGAKVLLFFDSCHSGGLIRGDEEIPEGSRAIFDDTRAIADQKRPDIPEYDWLESLRGNDNGLNSIATAVGENIACLAACGRTELAREIREQGGAMTGAMTSNLIEILNDNNQKGPNLTFLQIMEKIREALNKKNLSQTPDISGDTDTIAFCMHNLVKSSPFPYILTEVVSEEPKKIQFLSAYMLPLITEGSRFHLFDTSDSEMTNILMTIEVGSVSNCSNNATAVTVIDV